MQLASALLNWVPYRLATSDGSPHCRWLYTGTQSYTAPFFDDTISACMGLPENSTGFKSISSIDVLPLWADESLAVPPSAFIFHVSRCGSTLIAQLLGLSAQHIVLAETPFIDQLLRFSYTHGDNSSLVLPQALRAAIQLYGRKRRGDESHLFIKSDSWHLCFYERLRLLYPAVPFMLLYRSPDEVLRSQRRRRGMQAVQGVIEPEIFGFDRSVVNDWPLDDYMCKVLERYFTIMLEIADRDLHVLLVNYNEPILSIMQRIAGVTGITIDDPMLQLMQERSRYHAKYPDQVFQEPVDEDELPAALEPVMALYHLLDAKRAAISYRIPVAGYQPPEL